MGQLIALLLVAQWLERQSANLVAQVLFRVSYYNEEPDHAAAIYHFFVNYTYLFGKQILTQSRENVTFHDTLNRACFYLKS